MPRTRASSKWAGHARCGWGRTAEELSKARHPIGYAPQVGAKVNNMKFARCLWIERTHAPQWKDEQIRSGGVAFLRCKAMQVFWGQIPISMRSTRQGRPKGGGFWTLTPINRGRRRLPCLSVSLIPRLLGSESKKTCPSGIPAGAARPYWNPTPINASHRGTLAPHLAPPAWRHRQFA